MIRRSSIALFAAPFIAILILILLAQRAGGMIVRDVKNIKWSKENDDFIFSSVKLGRSFQWIADQLDVTRNAVIGRYNRMRDDK